MCASRLFVRYFCVLQQKKREKKRFLAVAEFFFGERHLVKTGAFSRLVFSNVGLFSWFVHCSMGTTQRRVSVPELPFELVNN